MLRSMTIKNIALIENITLTFGKGLHILSGETGAGKSIVVDAVNLLLGTRADRELIRSGEEKAFVEAFFDVENNMEAKDFLASHQLETEQGEIMVSREISQTGKNICRIGGIAMPLSLFRQFTTTLMDIHGQHEHQFLLDEKRQLAFLDEFGGASHQLLLTDIKKAYHNWRQGNKHWKELKKSAREKEQRIDTLRFQLEELKGAKLVRGEEEELIRQKDILRNNQKIKDLYDQLYVSLWGKNEKKGAIQFLENALEAMEGLADFFPEKELENEGFKTLFYELENEGDRIDKEYHKMNFDPGRLDEIEERLDLLRRLERKYGTGVDEMIDYQLKISQEYQMLLNLEENLELEKEKQLKLLKEYRRLAKGLTLQRTLLAKKLEEAMEEQLKDLGMGKTRFVIEFEQRAAEEPKVPQEAGDDQVVFLIAPNPGEPLHPLTKTASGGELSRLMLAIKSITAQSGFIGTMIFDEIDTGISGNIAWVVGEKMAKIARYQQVICVTHLAQIAAMADRAYLVEKTVEGQRTKTQVLLLNDIQKEKELARLIGGTDEIAGKTGLEHALSMLKAAEKIKSKLLE